MNVSNRTFKTAGESQAEYKRGKIGGFHKLQSMELTPIRSLQSGDSVPDSRSGFSAEGLL